MKGIYAFALLPLLAAASPVLVDTIHHDAAPLLSSVNSQVLPDSYIVVFKKHVSHASASEHHAWVQSTHHDCETTKMKRSLGSQFPVTAFGGLKHTYNIVGEFLGYSGHFDESVIEQVRRHPDVRIPTLISPGLLARDLTDSSWHAIRSNMSRKIPRFTP